MKDVSVPERIEMVLEHCQSARKVRDDSIEDLNRQAVTLCALVGYRRDSHEGRILSGCCYSGNDFEKAMKDIMVYHKLNRRKPDAIRGE